MSAQMVSSACYASDVSPLWRNSTCKHMNMVPSNVPSHMIGPLSQLSHKVWQWLSKVSAGVSPSPSWRSDAEIYIDVITHGGDNHGGWTPKQ